MAFDSIKKLDTQAEEIRTGMNPLSAIPSKVMSARETCIAAFEEARNAFGHQMGPAFEKAISRVGTSDFQISRDGSSHTISTRMANGGYLTLNVDEKTVTLTLVERNGKEDSIMYDGKEILRRRSV